ncbi:MAG: IS200/IS605 family transposase [Verrucomicrobiia bacterium]
MANSYIACFMHCVFSTKERRQQITDDVRERLWAYVGGIARENDMRAMAIGGTADHIHVLLSLPATMSVAKAVQLIKGGSSKWIHDTFPEQGSFAWQEGYGAFSVSKSRADDTIAYINGQATHHAKRSFQDEYRALMEKHGIEWDERYVWG